MQGTEESPALWRLLTRVCRFPGGGDRSMSPSCARLCRAWVPSAVGSARPGFLPPRLRPPTRGRNMKPFYQREAGAARLRLRKHRTSLTSAPQRAVGRRTWGAKIASRRAEGRGPGWSTFRTDVGLRGRRPWGQQGRSITSGEGSASRRGSRGPDPGAGLGSAMRQLSPGKTPARRREAGRLVGTAGTKAARGRMQSWKNPMGRRGGGGRGEAARAPQPCHLRRAARAGLLPGPRPGAPQAGGAGRPGKTENAGPGREARAHGQRTSRPQSGCSRPRGEGRVVQAGTRLAHAALHTATWQLRQSVAACPKGAHTDPGIGADACSAAHTLLHTHDHLHARAHRHASCPQLPGQREGNGPCERGRNRGSSGRSPSLDTEAQKLGAGP